MRKLIGGIVGLALLASAPSVAQAQCLLCGIVGFAIGASVSSSDPANAANPDVSGNGGAILYIAPRISERINEPLAVHIASSLSSGFSDGKERNWYRKWQGSTIQEIFDRTVDHSDRYVILEVMRVIQPSEVEAAVFWFAYLEKNKVVPLEKLSPPSQNK